MGSNNESYVFSVGSIGGRNVKTRYGGPGQVKPLKQGKPSDQGKPSPQGESDQNYGIVQSQPRQVDWRSYNNTDQIQPPKQGPFPQHGPGAVSYAYTYTPYGYQYPPPPYYGGCPPPMAGGGYYGGGYYGGYQGQGYPGQFAPHHGGYGMSHNNYGGAHMNLGGSNGGATTGAPVYGGHDQNHIGAHVNMGVPAGGGGASATATVYNDGQHDAVKLAHAHGELKPEGQGQLIQA
ncbi:hypothetical protein EJB05_34200 [Eragrostis curvula]|uniref:Uncharacterized protein n=1 Tax=Eragrostis curvula TaxID=38414 RepID=A0A5J9U3V3_9POAL|nr:hypothetical protein EJB05_34200 [Eragrostis curvula]